MDIMSLIIGIVVGLVVGGVVGYLVGNAQRKKKDSNEIGTAAQQAKKIIEDGIKAAETKKKELLLEAKEEIIRAKNDSEREMKDRRNELSGLEKRLISKEESLDRKIENIEHRTETLNRKIKENERLREEIEEMRQSEITKLEEVAGLTAEQAKEEMLEKLEGEIRHETAMRVIEIESEMRENADQKAKEIVSLAIQRCAADYSSEITVSVVPLPSDDMKGRIIGREGRNIRTIETLTGVDLIIDDTPEAITLSSFDPVRREVARLSLEKLINDGRIHPSRIEEMVEKSKREVENSIKQAGEKAVFEVGIHGLSGELVRMLGRLKYRTSYGQNVLVHSIEVAHLSGIIADELGVDSTLAKRAGLLHDIGKAMTQEVEGSHVQLGVDIAKKYKENKDVIHAIEAHHGDTEPRTIIAMIVQAADAISAARPGARREDLDNYIKRLKKLEEISESFDGVEKAYAIQAGREVRIMVRPEDVSDEQMVLVARDIVKKIESELEYPGQIKINVIRESRAIDYAK